MGNLTQNVDLLHCVNSQFTLRITFLPATFITHICIRKWFVHDDMQKWLILKPMM